MKELFASDDPIDFAYEVDGGSFAVRFVNGDSFTIESARTIVGAEELLLRLSNTPHELRLYGVATAASTAVQKVSRGDLRDRLGQFELGFCQNRWTSLVLREATARLSAFTIGEADRDLERRALAVAEATLALSRYARRHAMSELVTFVGTVGSTKLFELGVTLRRERLFATLKPKRTGLERLVQRVAPNHVVCREGEAADAMYVLLEGSIAVLHRGRCIARIEEAGEAFGEMALLLEGERTATLVAETECALYKIQERDLEQFHGSHRDLFFNVGATLAARLAQTLLRLQRLHRASGEGCSVYDAEFMAEGREVHARVAERLQQLQAGVKQPELQRIVSTFLGS